MNIQNIRESFVGLLSSLVEKNIINEEAKTNYIANLDAKLDESNEKSEKELADKFEKALKEATKQVCEKLQEELAGVEQNVQDATSEEVPEEGSGKTELSIADAFKKFLDCLKENNFKAFNALTDSFTDEQKELFKQFLDGTFGVEDDNDGKDTAGTEDGKPEEEQNAIDNENKDEQQPPQSGKQENAVPSEELDEACEIIGSMGKMFEEAGLSDIFESIMLEASPNINALLKKQEREYERFLKQSIKNIARKNKELQMTGGVLGGVRRIKNLDEVLSKLRKKLYLSECENTKLKEQFTGVSDKLYESEAKNRSLNEQLKDVKGDNNKLLEENVKLKKNEKLLTEAVETAKNEASINEAKAYLTESVKDFSSDMKHYLKKHFEGQGIDAVKKGLNEAVEAYRSERREERQQLRKNSVVSMSRTVNEAVEKNVDTEEDQFVVGMTKFANSIIKH